MRLVYAFLIYLSNLFQPVFSQTDDHRLSLHFSQNLRDYNVSLLADKLISFDSSLSQTYRTGIQYLLTRHWTLSTALNNGFLFNQTAEQSVVKKTFLTGIDADILYRFDNNGKIKQGSLVAPFISFGYDLSYLYRFKKENLNPWRIVNSYGIGCNINLTQSHAIAVQTQMSQQLGGEFMTFMNYRIGYVYNVGNGKQKVKETRPEPDKDGDGIADKYDQCPDVAGLAIYAGCNKTECDDTLLRLAYDSVKMEVAGLKTEIGVMKTDLAQIRIILNQISEKAQTPKTEIKEEKKEEIIQNPVKPIETPKPKEIKPQVKPDDGVTYKKDGLSFYVITISTTQLQVAKQIAAKLRNDYPQVLILAQPNGFYRVGIYATSDRTEAMKVFEYVKIHEPGPVWLSYE